MISAAKRRGNFSEEVRDALACTEVPRLTSEYGKETEGQRRAIKLDSEYSQAVSTALLACRPRLQPWLARENTYISGIFRIARFNGLPIPMALATEVPFSARHYLKGCMYVHKGPNYRNALLN